MRKLLLLLFLFTLSSNALAEEKIKKSGSEGTFKYVKKLIFKDKVYKRTSIGRWEEWCNKQYQKKYQYSILEARQYYAQCSNYLNYDQSIFSNQDRRRTIDFLELEYNKDSLSHSSSPISCKLLK